MNKLTYTLLCSVLSMALMVPAVPVAANQIEETRLTDNQEDTNTQATQTGEETVQETGDNTSAEDEPSADPSNLEPAQTDLDEENQEDPASESETSDSTDTDTPSSSTSQSSQTSSQPAEVTITDNTSAQNYILDGKNIVNIVNQAKEPLVLDGCTFTVSAKPAKSSDTLHARSIAAKIFVSGNVQFTNCTFTVQNLDTAKNAAAMMEISGGLVEMDGCTLQVQSCRLPLFSVETGSTLEWNDTSISLQNASASIVVLNGGNVVAQGSTIQAAQQTGSDPLFALYTGTLSPAQAFLEQMDANAEEESEETDQTAADSKIAAAGSTDTAKTSDTTETADTKDAAEDKESTEESTDEDVEAAVAQLALSSSSIGVDGSTAAILDIQAADTTRKNAASPIVSMDASSITLHECTDTLENISLMAHDSTISLMDCENGLDLDQMQLHTSSLAISGTQNIGLQLNANSNVTNSSVKISDDPDAINTLLSKNTVLEIDECGSKVSLGNVSFEKNAKIVTSQSSPVYYDLNTSTQYPAEEEETEPEITPQPEPEKTITSITVDFLSLDGKQIRKPLEEKVDNFVSIQDFVHNLDKGINGYNYVKYEYETDDENNSVHVELYYEVKEKYSVAINYYVEGSSVPIHFANVFTNLTEGQSYDVSRFNAIEIPGYTYAYTDGKLKGTAGGANHTIHVNCYYTRNDGTEDKNDSSMQPVKGETVNTATETHTGLYMILLVSALVILAAVAGVLIVSKKKKK